MSPVRRNSKDMAVCVGVQSHQRRDPNYRKRGKTASQSGGAKACRLAFSAKELPSDWIFRVGYGARSVFLSFSRTSRVLVILQPALCNDGFVTSWRSHLL